MNGPQKSATRNKLVETVDRVYQQFSSEIPDVIEGCPCCLETRGVDVLLATPLRRLSGDQLWRYISGVYLTVGGDRDFRYLMPRILELAALAPSEVPDTEIVLSKLGYAAWANWSDAERAAILEFVDAWIADALEEDIQFIADGWVGDNTESIFCGLAYAEIPFSNWLARLSEPRFAPVIADMKERYPNQLSAFWEDVPTGLAEFSTVLSQGAA